jgi:hypothetical protein
MFGYLVIKNEKKKLQQEVEEVYLYNNKLKNIWQLIIHNPIRLRVSFISLNFKLIESKVNNTLIAHIVFR